MAELFPSGTLTLVFVGVPAFLAGCGAGNVAAEQVCVEGDCGAGRTCYEGACVDLCNRDGDCRPGTACQHGVCLEGERAAPVTCVAPDIQASTLAPSAEIFVGFTVSSSATVTLSETDDACPLTTSWAVCGAPATSLYASADCVELGTSTDVVFAPDRRGTYELRFRAATPGQERSLFLGLVARAEWLLAETAVLDRGAVADDIIRYRDRPCIGWSETECDVPGCSWNADIVDGVSACWFDCSGATNAADCRNLGAQNGGNCLWTGVDCNTVSVTLAAECLIADQEACADLSTCNWVDALQACLPACAELADLGVCGSSSCTTTPEGACNRSIYESPIPVPVALFSDGGDLVPLRTGPLGFRYDPNGKFPASNVLGSGQPTHVSGMDFLPSQQLGVFPAAYLYERQDAAAGGTLCRRAVTLLAWKGGGVPGVPAMIEDLGPLRGDSAVDQGTQLMASQPDIVASADGQSFVAVYVPVEPGDYTYDTDESPCSVGEFDFRGYAFTRYAAGAGGTAPLYYGLAGPLQIVRVEDRRVVRGSLWARPGEFPCEDAGDCGDTNGGCDLDADNDGNDEALGVCRHLCSAPDGCGSAACESDQFCGDCGPGQTCPGEFEIDGALPRLHDNGAGIVFSHVVCSGASGRYCDEAFRMVLIAGDVLEPSTGRFVLANPQRLVNLPAGLERDPLWLGDFDAQGSLVYLHEDWQELLLEGTGGDTETLRTSRTSLVRRDTTRTGSVWTVGARQDLFTAVRDDSAAPSPVVVCDGDIYPAVAVRSAAQHAASSDGQTLAYVRFVRSAVCAGSTMMLGSPRQTVLVLADLSVSPPTERPIDLAGCAGVEGAVVGSIRFIADDTQIVFSTHAPEDTYAQLWRMNVDGSGPGVCPATLLADAEIARSALAAVVPDVQTVGISFAPTATRYMLPTCQAASPGMWLAVASLALLRRFRRRGGPR